MVIISTYDTKCNVQIYRWWVNRLPIQRGYIMYEELANVVRIINKLESQVHTMTESQSNLGEKIKKSIDKTQVVIDDVSKRKPVKKYKKKKI